MAGGLLLYAAFPPVGFWPLAWIAPIFWLGLVQRPDLGGRAAWWSLWAASLVHWLLMLQGIRLAHWANHFGWMALAAYLAAYLPMFVLLARFAVHRLRVPLAIAAPVVWTGLELARGHLITGFSMGLLGHTQVDWVHLIQIADLCGAYGVSFLVMLGAACVLQTLPLRRMSWDWRPAVVGAAALALTVGYGQFRLREGPSSASESDAGRPLKVASFRVPSTRSSSTIRNTASTRFASIGNLPSRHETGTPISTWSFGRNRSFREACRN